MKHTPKTIKRTLKRCINEISEHPEVFAKNPKKDFTRVRKLPFNQVLKSVLSMTGKSIRGELMDYFDLTAAMPTVSAFVQQRNKIDYRAFETIFKTFTKSISEQQTFKGYRLLAIDGSDLHTPTNKNERESFYEGKKSQKSYNLLHLNALYDIQRKVYVDAIVQGGKHSNEHKAFVTMIDRDDAPIPTIYIADRGYESYNNMAHIIEKGDRFLIRIKDLGGNGIASRLKLNLEGEFDIEVSLNLTRKQNREAKRSLDYLPHNVNFDYLPKSCKNSSGCDVYALNFRLLRFKLSDDSYELLATNLEKSVFEADDLKSLYNMRWGIETSFRDLKYSLALSYFHSKKTENILQEIFARLTMYNFAELITSHVVIKQKNRLHPCKINFAAAVHICRIFFLKNISPSFVETLLLQHLLPIRNRPTSPRKIHTKAAPSFTYRIP